MSDRVPFFFDPEDPEHRLVRGRPASGKKVTGCVVPNQLGLYEAGDSPAVPFEIPDSINQNDAEGRDEL